ncbi:MAG: hypothetical protein IT431_17865 [Phycisphaerales bacterium]|nr:hypothetical protein [Phycisphaerales bacterium]
MVQLICRKPTSLFDAPAGRDEPVGGLSRLQLVERIMDRNRSATETYLGTFSDRALTSYLAHLDTVGQPRGGRWERPGDTPAIVVRETAD